MIARPPGTAGVSGRCRRVAADERDPVLERARVGGGAGAGERRRADPGVGGERDLERLGRGAERALDAAGGGDRECDRSRGRLGVEPVRDRRRDRRRRRAGGAGRVPAGAVVPPAERGSEPRHHAGAGEVGALAVGARRFAALASATGTHTALMCVVEGRWRSS